MLKPVVSHLRKLGLLSNIYLDDLLLLGYSYESCTKNVSITTALLEELGFIINYKKSELTPSQTCSYLGFIYNAKNMIIQLPRKKREKINKIVNLKLHQSIKIRKFAKILGVLVSCCPAVEYGWLYTKASERQKFLALEKNHDNYEKYMVISSEVLDELKWWKRLEKTPMCRIRNCSYDLEIYSDASLTGWGVYCNGQKANGHWKESELSNYINYLELLASYFGLKILAKNHRNAAILLHIDNTTAISYINRMGGVQYENLSKLAKTIWQWCEKREIWIHASYIASKDNVEADTESRKLQENTEIEISNTLFQKIISEFGKPEIDLFASRSNAKCEKYVSWRRDPESVAIDAFTISWEGYYFYAFPPCSLILKVLRKIKNESARGIMVVPEWPAQLWYPMFCSMLSAEPIKVPAKNNLMISSTSMDKFWRKTTLVVGVLSGNL
ncbi:hypothetical protein TSAR_005754 [Trichomalopsis sarcophagae]|uniref:Reverse transcriptase domain-containing protein n=1 Tax=Trichomalopsis sarcophagae TaxID=543379 RepID=A0A232EK93_9HYME|nr:hypothetical protein TSAR_005754 [Trichomalopsis sarcophagae]